MSDSKVDFFRRFISVFEGEIPFMSERQDIDSMSKEAASERMTYLYKTIAYHSNRYYNDDDPEIEDFEYDALMNELKALERHFLKDHRIAHAKGRGESFYQSVFSGYAYRENGEPAGRLFICGA